MEGELARFCPHCWHEVPKGQERCPTCGHSLATAQEPDLVDKYIAEIRHRDPTRAGLAIMVLSKLMHEPRAIQPLIDLVETSTDGYVVSLAVEALGRFADPHAVAPLGRVALRHGTPLVVRVAVVEALAQIGGPEALDFLQRMQDDTSPSVRERVARLLLRVADPTGSLSEYRNTYGQTFAF
jgi:HEAT repeat protein